MGLLNDLFLILITGMQKLSHEGPAVLRNGLICGILLGVACWVACSYFSRLWNLRYRATWKHHLICAVATVLTLLLTLCFVALRYPTLMVETTVDLLRNQEVKDGHEWQRAAILKASEQVRMLGIGDSGRYTPPVQGGNTVSMDKDKSQQTTAAIYASSAVQYFLDTHQFLSFILSADNVIPTQLINDDVARFFAAHRGVDYPFERAVNLAIDYIKQELSARILRFVFISRTVLVCLFLFVQAIPFGLIGFSAYRDLKVTT
ncbi:MAG: hypothetical protein ACLGPL_09200 [Acidobacteriota bacterium]